MIPLVGCRVEFVSGPHAGKAGAVAGVIDYRARLRTMTEEEASLFVRGRRATHGDTWHEHWYEAIVSLDEGAVVEAVGGGVLKVLTPEQVRGSRYRSL
jgi:hypothetical protein